MASELVIAVTALTDIMAERNRQIEKGYTREHDIEEGVFHLVHQAERRLEGWSTRKQLVEAAALLIAAIIVEDQDGESV
jgi:hypothetical protein